MATKRLASKRLARGLKWAVAGALMVLGVGAFAPGASADMKKVQFSLDVSPDGRHSYFYLALEKGYYKDEGLDVEILRGRGSGSVVKEVAAGTVQIGFADAGTMLIAKGNEDVPVKMAAVIYRQMPQGFVFLEDKHVKSPKDLVGKTIADQAGSSTIAIFPAFAKQVGIPGDAVKWVYTDFNSMPGMLITGKTDGISQYIVGLPLLAERAAPQKLTFFAFKDYGFQIYSNGIIASDTTFKQDPGMVRSFIKATLRGLKDALADPAEAGRITHKYLPFISEQIAIDQTKAVGEIVGDASSKTHGIGYVDPADMQHSIDMIGKIFDSKKKLTLADVMVPGMAGK